MILRAQTNQSRMLSYSQTLATNKAKNRCYENSDATDRDYSKNAPNEHFYLRVRWGKRNLALLHNARKLV